MTRKRKLDRKSSDLQKPSPIEVIIEDVSSHPFCLHGPTLLFSNEKGRYYSCSSCRNKRDCTLHISEEDWQKEGVRQRNEKYYNLIPKIDKTTAWNTFIKVKSCHSTVRAYCVTCEELYVITESKKHLNHNIITHLTDEQLAKPSSWLPPKENDEVEAQYLFTNKTVGTVLRILENNHISNIVCIGTPSVHEAAQSSDNKFNSILLDFDKRHHQFHPPNKFLWYNMFNDYLFDANQDEKVLKKFIKDSSNSGICVVMDPPFGGRVEALVYTLRELSTLYRKVCNKPDDETIPVLWAFPYFSEPYIRNLMPEIKMHDFQVEYENHKKFQNKSKGRKFGSPVRFFTNLPLSTINLSNDSNYKLCDKCKYWVSVTNKHCFKCGECTSKNGMTYEHCNVCKRCVKPTFFHCKECGRCCQQKGHMCGVTVESQSCYNCGETGHKRKECSQLKNNDSAVKKKNKV